MESQIREPNLDEIYAEIPAETPKSEIDAAFDELPPKTEEAPQPSEIDSVFDELPPQEPESDINAIHAEMPDLTKKKEALKKLTGRDDEKTDELLTELQQAEAERKEVLANIAKNESIEAEAKKLAARGADSAEIERFKREKGYVFRSPSRELATTLTRLGKGETLQQSDVERAYDPSGYTGAPVRGFEGIVGDIAEQGWKPWTWNFSKWAEGFSDKNARQRVKEELSQPIVDDNGFVNPIAVNQSNLPRTSQNELMSVWAYQRTGIPREMWKKVLERAGGVTDEQGIAEKTARRAFQVADSYFGIPSYLSLKSSDVSKQLEELKKGKPGTTLEITRDKAGNYYANGVKFGDVDEKDNLDTIRQKGWAALVDNTKGLMRAQATENWTQFLTMLMPGAGEVAGGLRAASGAAKAAGLTKTAKVASGLGTVSGVIGKAAAPIVEPLTTGAKLINAKKYAQWAKSSPRAANLANAIDKALGVTVAMPAVTAAFAPEGIETQAAAGAFVMGLPLGALSVGTSLAKAAAGAAAHPMAPALEQNKPLKRVLATEREEDLPKFVRTQYLPYVKPKEQSYADFRQNQLALRDFSVKSWDAMHNLMTGVTGPEQVAVFKRSAARDPNLRKALDDLSVVQSRVFLFDEDNKPIVDSDGNPQYIVRMGLTPVGKENARILHMIGVNTDSHVSKKQQEVHAGVASIENQKIADTFKILRRKFNNATREIPPEVLNDREKFLKYVQGNVLDVIDSTGKAQGIHENSLKGFAQEINDMVTGTDPEFAYERFVSDVMKMWAPLIDSGESPSPTKKMSQLLGYIANPPELGMDYQLLQQRANLPATTVKNLAGESVTLEPLSPTATAKQLLQNPRTIREIIRYSQGVVSQYHGLKGAASLKGAKEAFREAKLQAADNLVKRRIQTTLDAEHLKVQTDRIKNSLQSVTQVLVDGTEKTVRKGGKKITVKIPALIERVQNSVSEISAKLAAGEATKAEADAIAIGERHALLKHTEVPQSVLMAMPAEYRATFVEANKANATRNRLLDQLSIAETQAKMLEEDKIRYAAKQPGTIRKRYEDIATKHTSAELYGVPEVRASVEFFREVAKRADDFGVFKTRYGENVLRLVAAKIHNSWDGTSFHLADNDAGFIRLMADENFAREVMKLDIPRWEDVAAMKKKDEAKYNELRAKRNAWGRAETDIVRLADFVATTTRQGQKLKRQVTDLDAILANRSRNLPAMNAMLTYMRETYNVSKMGKELVDKRLAKIMDLSVKLAQEGKVYRPANVKLLTWMASSNMVNRFRIEHPHTPYLITYQAEVDNIFRVMRDVIPEVARVGIESVSKTLGIPADTLDAAVISGWFINPRSSYDGAGYLSTALEAARWFKEPSIRGAYSSKEGEFFRSMMLEEVNTNVFSRAHVIDIDRHVPAKAVGTTTAKFEGEKFALEFHRELEKLKVNGKSYTQFQTQKPFVDVFKKLMYGHAGRTDYLVVPEIGAGGKIVHNWTDTGKVLWRWLGDEVGFAKMGAERSLESLQATIDRAMKESVPPNANAEQIRAIRNKYDAIQKSIHTFWNVQDADFDTYKMAIEAMRVVHDFDYRRVQKFNEINKELNNRRGTRYAGLEWFPHRLEAGSQILAELQTEPDNLSHPALMKQMFGRSIASSPEGQLAKCQGIPDVDHILMHPQEAFDVETTRLFQGAYTRDPMRRLYEHAILLNDAGFNGAARLMTAIYIGAERELRLNTTSAVEGWMDRGVSPMLPGKWTKNIAKYTVDPVVKYVPRATGIFVDTGMLLARPGLAFGENPFQAALAGLGNNPRNALRVMGALVQFYPKATARALAIVGNSILNVGRGVMGKERVKLSAEDLMGIAAFSRPYSPAYAEVRVRLLQGLNGARNSQLTQVRRRINWEASKVMKGVDKVVGDKTAAMFDWVNSVTKEISEFTIVDIGIGQAMSIWEEALAKARNKELGVEERTRAVYDVIHTQFEGTFGNDVAAWKTAGDVVKSVDENAPLKHFEEFATQYVFNSTGRFDSQNAPKFLHHLDKLIPGAGEFYVPYTQSLYRLGLAIHAATKSGVNPVNTGAAAMAAMATFGTAYAMVKMASMSGISWFNRLQNVPGMESAFGDGEEVERLATPSIRGGRMQHRAWLSAVMAVFGMFARDRKAAENGTLYTEEHEKSQTDTMIRIFDQLAKLSPATLFVDIVKSPARYGYLQMFADPEEIKSLVSQMRQAGYTEKGRLPTPETPDPARETALGVLDWLADGGKFLTTKWRNGQEVTPEDMRMVLGKYGKAMPEAAIQEVMEDWVKREQERKAAESRTYLYGDTRKDEKTQRE